MGELDGIGGGDGGVWRTRAGLRVLGLEFIASLAGADARDGETVAAGTRRLGFVALVGGLELAQVGRCIYKTHFFLLASTGLACSAGWDARHVVAETRCPAVVADVKESSRS